MSNSELLAQLGAVLPANDILTDAVALAGYGTDWTGRWHSEPIAVLRPQSISQVQAAVNTCRAAGVPLLVQGGNTGLVGGAVGDGRAHILLSTRGLRQVMEFDRSRSQLRVSAGFTLAEVQAKARKHGLIYPVDLAARDSATIGGNIATNAGGIRVLAYGNTGDQVVDVLAVGADGELFDARNLIGSEGRFGVIVEATLQLRPERVSEWTALVPIDSVADGFGMGWRNRAHLTAAEIFQGSQADEVARVAGLPQLPASAWWLLLEGDNDCLLTNNALFAMQRSDVERFWAYRERQTETIARHQHVLKIDTSVPADQTARFVDGVEQIASVHGVRPEQLYVFGHLLVGNLHLAFVECDGFAEIEREVLRLVRTLGGFVAGEHGVGQAKVPYLDDNERFIRNALKNRFDSSSLFLH